MMEDWSYRWEKACGAFVVITHPNEIMAAIHDLENRRSDLIKQKRAIGLAALETRIEHERAQWTRAVSRFCDHELKRTERMQVQTRERLEWCGEWGEGDRPDAPVSALQRKLLDDVEDDLLPTSWHGAATILNNPVSGLAPPTRVPREQAFGLVLDLFQSVSMRCDVLRALAGQAEQRNIRSETLAKLGEVEIALKKAIEDAL